jgi:hypothetical protein
LGDLLWFDNTGALQKAAPYDSAKRLLDRATLRGEELIV